MLALIAGTGALPAALVAGLRVKPLVCVLEGFEPDLPAETDLLRFRLETFGTLLETLKARGITQLCMVGAIRRPAIDPDRIDAATRPLLPAIAGALASGDDGALRAVMGLIEAQGIRIVAAHEIRPDLLPPAGLLTEIEPAMGAMNDAARAAELARALAPADLGQALVVREGQAMAVEAASGTDWMLRSIADGTARGGILYKAPKAGQDRRADLPVIGPETARGAIAARLAGVVIEAGGVMVLDAAETAALLEDAGLFLWVRE